MQIGIKVPMTKTDNEDFQEFVALRHSERSHLFRTASIDTLTILGTSTKMSTRMRARLIKRSPDLSTSQQNKFAWTQQPALFFCGY